MKGYLDLLQCRVKKAEHAAAQQAGEVQGRWKARLCEAEAAHAERARALQHEMRQRLEQAHRLAEEGVASARRWGPSRTSMRPPIYDQPAA